MENQTLPLVVVDLKNYQGLAQKTAMQPGESTQLDTFLSAALFGGMKMGISAGNCANDLKRRLAYGKALPERSDAADFGRTAHGHPVEALVLTAQQFRLIHAALGLMSEAGELLDQLLQHVYAKQPLDVVNLQEEFGDQFWYLAEGHNAVALDFQRTMQLNIDKLRARYGEKFSEAAALTRDLTTERKVLEGGTPATTP